MCELQAAQVDDNTKTTNAVVLVTIEDVDDNEPEFDQSDYTVIVPENSPRDHFVLQATVTDRDQVCVSFRDSSQMMCKTSCIYTTLNL